MALGNVFGRNNFLAAAVLLLGGLVFFGCLNQQSPSIPTPAATVLVPTPQAGGATPSTVATPASSSSGLASEITPSVGETENGGFSQEPTIAPQ